MKKTLFVAALLLLSSAAFAQEEVTIKRGKATMSEAEYNRLKDIEKRYEANAQVFTTMQMKLRRLESMIEAPLADFTDSASYAVGCDMFRNLERQNLGLNYGAVSRALIDCGNSRPLFNQQGIETILQRFSTALAARQNERLQKNISDGKEFLTQNSNNKSIYTTPSGLQYKKITSGNGKHPKATDKVKVHYTGRLIDGTIFDSSVQRGAPIEFPLNQVIPGWTEGLQIMDEGSKYILFIPYNLAYGERDMGDIPAGSTLIFEVELLEIVK